MRFNSHPPLRTHWQGSLVLPHTGRGVCCSLQTHLLVCPFTEVDGVWWQTELLANSLLKMYSLRLHGAVLGQVTVRKTRHYSTPRRRESVLCFLFIKRGDKIWIWRALIVNSVSGVFRNLHWHSIMKFLYGLVVDGYGHLCVSIKGKLYIVAGPVFPRCLVTRQLQVFTAPEEGEQWKQ